LNFIIIPSFHYIIVYVIKEKMNEEKGL